MSVPLDRLYNFLYDLVNRDVVIYRWLPHGSKNIKDLGLLCLNTQFKSYSDPNLFTKDTQEEWLSKPLMFCHDQEPLVYQQYSESEYREGFSQPSEARSVLAAHPLLFKELLSSDIRAVAWENLYDMTFLTHSEMRSQVVTVYESAGFIPIYFWSHGIIARDWFRYAEHDPVLKTFNIGQIKHDFLIYNRAWTGTREYRLKFTEMLINKQLVDKCLTSFAQHDSDIDYRSYEFKNKEFSLTNTNLEKYLPKNSYGPCASADYASNDYATCGIEVVLETLFDDQRWHLTEKALRPIACGMPFILASTVNSLEYLRSYGFKTFDGLIDETYDQVVDPLDRLNAIISEMSRISNLSAQEKSRLWEQLRKIAAINQAYFFSNEFQDRVVTEFKSGFEAARQKMQLSTKGIKWAALYDFTLKHFPDLINEIFAIPNEHTWVRNWLQKNYR